MVYPTYTKLYSIIAELILFPREIETSETISDSTECN